MQEVDKILTLLEKGYTKAEIDSMLMTPIDPGEPSPEEEPKQATENTEPVEELPTADDPVPKTLPEQLTTFMDEMRSSIADLTAAVQSRNIQTNSVDTTRPEDMNELLAAYINPPRANK